MKDFFQSIKRGLVMGVTALIVICGGLYIFIKARSSTNPGTTDDQPNTLYVNTNETLTAAKRNTLADRNRVYDSGRFDVKNTADTNATTDGSRNYYTVTHNLNTDKLLTDVYFRNDSASTTFNKAQTYGQYWDGSKKYCRGYSIESINTTSLKIRTRYSGCNYHYPYSIVGTNSTGQYRVIVRTF